MYLNRKLFIKNCVIMTSALVGLAAQAGQVSVSYGMGQDGKYLFFPAYGPISEELALRACRANHLRPDGVSGPTDCGIFFTLGGTDFAAVSYDGTSGQFPIMGFGADAATAQANALRACAPATPGHECQIYATFTAGDNPTPTPTSCPPPQTQIIYVPTPAPAPGGCVPGQRCEIGLH